MDWFYPWRVRRESHPGCWAAESPNTPAQSNQGQIQLDYTPNRVFTRTRVERGFKNKPCNGDRDHKSSTEWAPLCQDWLDCSQGAEQLGYERNETVSESKKENLPVAHRRSREELVDRVFRGETPVKQTSTRLSMWLIKRRGKKKTRNWEQGFQKQGNKQLQWTSLSPVETTE